MSEINSSPYKGSAQITREQFLFYEMRTTAKLMREGTNNEQFREDIKKRIGKAVDTSEYEEQAERLTKQIRNKTKTLKRKALTIDNFDWAVKNADSLYDSLNEDYLRLHDEVKVLVGSLEEVEGMIEKIKNQQVTQDGIINFILRFGKAYKGLPEIKKKNLVNRFIEKIEIFPEEQEDGSVIKSITFKFKILKDGKLVDNISFGRQTTDTPVETVVCLMHI